MKAYKGLVINISFLILFYALRCLIMNVNALFNVVWIIEFVIILALLFSFLTIENRTKEKVTKSLGHIAAIAALYLFIGHLTSILTLHLYHYKAMEVFRKHQANVPEEENKINGEWILEIPSFSITDDERIILEENYSKSSPCLFKRGHCYFELGGFLKNSGGYCFQLNGNSGDGLGSFGYHRVKKTTRLISSWIYYE